MKTTGERYGIDSSGHAKFGSSSAPKGKLVRLKEDKYDGFNVPTDVFNISKMSPSKRKSLELRLRSDLQRIRSIMNVFQLRHGNTASRAALSLSASGSAHKQGAPGPNCSQVKCEDKRKFRSQLPASKLEAKLMRQCLGLLKRLMSHQHGWVFNDPVDVVKLKIPDYYDIIEHPMDLGTIQNRISSGAYKSSWDFAADVRLTFANAMKYNPPGNPVHSMANTMSEFFEDKWKLIENKLSVACPHVKRETEAAEHKPLSEKKKTPPVGHSIVVKEKLNQRLMAGEKESLYNRLKSFMGEFPADIGNLSQQCGGTGRQDDGEMVVDLRSLREDTLFELQKLLDKYLLEKQKNQQVKAEQCDTEVMNGVRNSSTYPCRGNEKDAKHRISNSSSSTCSSSDSGSSSSDSDSESDSGSTSGSESHERVASPMKTSNENIVTELALDHEKGQVSTVDANRPIGKLDSPEQDTYPDPASVRTNVHVEEGENARSKRLVSSEKLHRVALLRHRFADTILKACEMTLNKGEKGNHEKLQHELEELERLQKEEKARLIAEAKAAEQAESKRKLELEREAARQALLKIEKSVEFNDFHTKDLEILITPPVEHVTGSVEDHMVSFKISGNNPLEQLGLFLKADDDEVTSVNNAG